jgi:hypothetical protein
VSVKRVNASLVTVDCFYTRMGIKT